MHLDGTIKGFEQISADIDGIFNHILLTWPEPSTTFPYGTYSIEILSTTNEGILGTIDVRFGPNENDEIVISRDATALVYAPESAAVDSPIRLFVQTTSDGLLIGDDPKDLLSTTHVHLPDDLQILFHYTRDILILTHCPFSGLILSIFFYFSTCTASNTITN